MSLDQTTLTNLTVPERLIPLLHGSNGRPYESSRPPKLLAAAELAELLLDGLVDVDENERLRPAEVGEKPRRDWMRAAVAELPADGTEVRQWLKSRRDTLPRQVAAAEARGLLTRGRGRFIGLFGYDRTLIAPEARAAVVDSLTTGSGTPQDPRRAVSARLVARSNLNRRLGLSSEGRHRLEELADAADQTPLPRAAVTALDVAIGVVVYTTVTGD